MGLFDFFKGTDINKEVENCKADSNAYLLDVRSGREYKDGHIPGSINVPVEDIEHVKNVITDFSKPVYIYCLSGMRAGRAQKAMSKMGYTDVKNIGGINSYKGITEN